MKNARKHCNNVLKNLYNWFHWKIDTALLILEEPAAAQWRRNLTLWPDFQKNVQKSWATFFNISTVKLSDKKRFDKEQMGVKEPFPVTNLTIYFIRIRNIWR